jgi:integrator complex subunit 2
MPENLIAQKAIMLGVTKDLNANFAGYLPVHCINHLLSARTFSKDQMPIQDWIKRQLLECQLPIHSFMVQVLENFAKSCFPSRDDSDYLKQIDEGFFWVNKKTIFF